MYKITKESIQPIVQKAYEEGRLLAQNVDPEKPLEYFYRRGDIGCAIGVALPQDVADSLTQKAQLAANPSIAYDSWCEELQDLHDQWANSRENPNEIWEYTAERAAYFKAHLYS